jgi:hypothetical protein
MSVQKEVKRIKKQIDDLTAELNRLELLVEEYPDLEASNSMTGITFHSASINPATDKANLTLGDGDTPSLYAVPFKDLYGFRIHSKPGMFEVAVSYAPGKGYVPMPDWERTMHAADIGPAAIQEVKEFLEHFPPTD